MAKTVPNTTTGDTIRRAREALGWSQAKLAAAAGTTQQTVDRIERGLTTHSRAIPGIEAALKAGKPSAIQQMTKMRTMIAERRGDYSPIPTRDHNFPLFMLTGDGAIELLYFSQLPIAWTDTPASYALIVNGNNLLPVFAQGEILYVDYDQPPAASGFIVAFEEGLTRGSLPSEDLPPVHVLRLLGENASHYHCETPQGIAMDLEKTRWRVDPVVSRYTPLTGNAR